MARAQKRLGRPPRDGKPAASRFELRLLDTTRKQWQAAADREGLTVSEFVVAAVELAMARGSTR